MSDLDNPSKEEQTRVKRRKVVKSFVGLLLWLKRLWFLSKLIDPLEGLLAWLTEGDGSGPLDNYFIGGMRFEDREALSFTAITTF